MKGREGRGAPSTDLLVCFPSRAHLSLMPKSICSPARPSEPNKHLHKHHHHHHHHNHHNHHPKKSGKGQASPLLWAKTKPTTSEIAEPTSPKVTCAGQIKVRPKSNPCKNWQSVMEEIERLHNNRKRKKKAARVEVLGFKKDVMQFLTCLRNIRFDFRCFGSFPKSDISSDDEDDDKEDEDYLDNQVGMEGSDDEETSRTVFSKWFMVLQENQNNELSQKQSKGRDRSCDEECVDPPCAPPPNALLLMRCRSAPAKSRLEEKEEENNDENNDEEQELEEEDKKAEVKKEEDEREMKENLVVMKYGTDFYKLSSDIAKETWVVGGIRDPLSRSRSWNR